MIYDKQKLPPGLATPTEINATPTSKTFGNTAIRRFHWFSHISQYSLTNLQRDFPTDPVYQGLSNSPKTKTSKKLDEQSTSQFAQMIAIHSRVIQK